MTKGEIVKRLDQLGVEFNENKTKNVLAAILKKAEAEHGIKPDDKLDAEVNADSATKKGSKSGKQIYGGDLEKGLIRKNVSKEELRAIEEEGSLVGVEYPAGKIVAIIEG